MQDSSREHYGDTESMEILFVPDIPTQEQLNRTWPATQEKMHLRVYGKTTHADAIRYTDPGAMVAAPNLQRLFQQTETTTRTVTVIHSSPTRPDQHPLHTFPYTVESPVFQVTGQVRFRPLQPLDLERAVDDIDAENVSQQERAAGLQRSAEDVRFGYPHHCQHKGLGDVRFPEVSFPEER